MGARRKRSVVDRLRKLPRPSPREAAIVGVLALVSVLALWRVAGLVTELREVRAARADLEGKRATLEQRHRALEQEAQFVSDPDQLEQELRSRFNYKKPGENVIVVIPPKSSTTTSTDE